jgi:hypothetical protein
MSFNLITEGSKDYMKYVLQLSEAKAKSSKKRKSTSTTSTPTGINIPTRPELVGATGNYRPRGSKPTQGGGAGGGKGLGQPENFQPRVGSELDPRVLFGVQSSFTNLHRKDETTGKRTTTGGMDYITNIAQASSFIDALDQNMPSLARFALGYSQLGNSNVDMNPGSAGSPTSPLGNTTIVNMGGATGSNITLNAATNQLNNMLPGATGSSKSSQFANKVLQYSKNLGALDPFNPLLGYKIGYDMLGGREIIKRTRELGAAQASGTESSMGHPSGFGYFGR